MKNNVYIRSDRSIFTISITRILLLLPMIIFGFYKNGIHLYKNGYVSTLGMFKPLILILGSALIGAIVNLIYEKLIKKSKDDLKSCLFSSFHIEYGVVLACLMPYNINYYIYFSVLLVIFFASKFLNNRVNTMCVCFLLIYLISYLFNIDFIYANSYELDKTFSLEFMDYIVGKGTGGIASTHILFLIIALVVNHITNNNKTSISVTAIITTSLAYLSYSLIKDVNFVELLFANNILFIMSYVITDSVTSCYTTNGKYAFGILSSLIAFGLMFLNPVIAPFISILIISLLNNLIDRKINVLFKK